MSTFPADYPHAQVHPPQRMGDDDVLLFTHWSGSPASSGRAALLVRRTAHGTEVLHWDEESGLQPHVALRPNATWRELVEAVAHQEWLGVDTYCRFGDLTLEGITGVPAFMLDLAWTGPEEKGAALALLDLADAQIEAIRKAVGSQIGGVVDDVRDVLSKMQELEDPPETLAQLVERLCPDGLTTIDALVEALDRRLEQQWEESQAG